MVVGRGLLVICWRCFVGCIGVEQCGLVCVYFVGLMVLTAV